jgi:hypothetical protein
LFSFVNAAFVAPSILFFSQSSKVPPWLTLLAHRLAVQAILFFTLSELSVFVRMAIVENLES